MEIEVDKLDGLNLVLMAQIEEEKWLNYFESKADEDNENLIKLKQIEAEEERLGLFKDPLAVTESELAVMLKIYEANLTHGLMAISKEEAKLEVMRVKKCLADANQRKNTIVFLQEYIDMTYDLQKVFLRDNKEVDQMLLQEVKILIPASLLKNKEYISKIVEQCATLKSNGKIVKVYVQEKLADHDNSRQMEFLYSNAEMEVFAALNNALIDNQLEPLRFCEGKSTTGAWTLETIINANKSIDNIVSYIKERKFTPFEAMLYIHRWITSQFSYQEGTAITDGRVLPSIIKDQKIVCSGYATLVKCIIDRLNLPGLEADIIGCGLYERKLMGVKQLGRHSHNLIRIRDDKYGIDGAYVEDACWDSKTKTRENGRGFAHCLYPVADLNNFSKGMIYVDDKDSSRLKSTLYDSDGLVFRLNNGRNSALVKHIKEQRYMKRIIRGGIKIYDENKYNSEPIPMDTFKKGLRALFVKSPNVTEEYVEQKIEEFVNDSIENHKSNFSNKADSCFNAETKQKIKAKSFAERDNRQ